MKHHCHARGCQIVVPPEMLMCRAHWARVPRKIQQAVWRNYRPGQCNDREPSEAWHVAADAAIGAVAAKEGIFLRPCEGVALAQYGFTESMFRGASY